MLMCGLVFLLGLLNLAAGLGFLFVPAKLATGFFLAPVGVQGLATLRADYPALLLTGAIFSILAAVTVRPAPLLVPIASLAIALAGRMLSVIVDGASATTAPPMIVEALLLLILGVAYRAFSRRG
jgi:hypothetical protein